MQEVFPDYNVDDHVVVDLPTQTIEGTVGYVGDTDVRIDPDDGYSWEHEVINKQQFEDGLRQDEPETEAPAQDEPEQLEENAPEPAGNFRITDDDLGAGGPKQKYARNIEAIRTLFTLEQEHRGATAEEQQVLSQYVGWGGLADVFDSSKENWASEYAELKGLLSETEYAAARESTLNAHFTSPVVIRAIYDAVERMGFHGGNILEPSMGVGNFFGMLPESMADSRLYGVELDSITAESQKCFTRRPTLQLLALRLLTAGISMTLPSAMFLSASTRSMIRHTTSWAFPSITTFLPKLSTKYVRAASSPL